jgi:hypothetical protein
MGNQKTAPAKARRRPAAKATGNAKGNTTSNPAPGSGNGIATRVNSAQMRRDLEGLDRLSGAYADAGRSTASKTAAFIAWAHNIQQSAGAAKPAAAGAAA